MRLLLFQNEFQGKTAKVRCRNCKKLSSCATNLKIHQRKYKCGFREEQKAKKVSCPGCRRSFETHFNLKVHQGRSNCGLSLLKSKFACKFCKFPLSNADKLRRHQKNSKCPECGAFVGCCRTVSAHLLECKSSGGVPSRPNPPCSICGDEYRSLSWHQDAAGHVCKKKCGQTFACYGLLRRHRGSCKRDTKCPHCENVLGSVQNLSKHVKVRQCPKCDRVEPCASLFRSHECVPIVRTECPYCLEACDLLRTHARPVRCRLCGFVQPCASLLAHHLQKCRFSGVLECPVCCEVLVSVSELTKHAEERHLRPAEEQISPEPRVFECDFCNEVFTRKRKLKIHIEKKHLVDFVPDIKVDTKFRPKKIKSEMLIKKEPKEEVEIVKDVYGSVTLKSEF